MRLLSKRHVDIDGVIYVPSRPMVLEFSLGTLTLSPNVLLRRHWSARTKMRDDYSWAITAALRTSDLKAWGCPSERVRVEITRQGGRTLDQDNLVGSVKILVDALRNVNLIRDDTPAAIDLIVRQQGGPREMRICLSTPFNPITDKEWP